MLPLVNFQALDTHKLRVLSVLNLTVRKENGDEIRQVKAPIRGGDRSPD